MVERKKKIIKSRIPFFTFFVGIGALVAYAAPFLPSVLEYDRSAVKCGEAWRIISGNLVHYSWDHLFFNLLVFVVMGWMLEKRCFRWSRSLSILSGVLTGASLFIAAPHIGTYGGLSGIVTFQCVFFALHELVSPGSPRRLMGGALLVLMTSKVAYEYGSGAYLFAHSARVPFVPVPLAHLVGFVTALVGFGVLAIWKEATGRKPRPYEGGGTAADSLKPVSRLSSPSPETP